MMSVETKEYGYRHLDHEKLRHRRRKVMPSEESLQDIIPMFQDESESVDQHVVNAKL